MISCMVLDDEQYARELLTTYISHVDHLQVSKTCRNTFEAESYLSCNQVDVVFMDIEMPGRKGTKFLKENAQKDFPLTVFTTAYSEYALDGFELDAVDYLLKPIGFQRFMRAVEKLKKILLPNQQVDENSPQTDSTTSIWVKEGYGYKKILFEDLLYVESMREYIAYHTINGRILELKSMAKIQKELPEKEFVRIHRSFLLAKKEIVAFSSNEVTLSNGRVFPIGKTYRKKLDPSTFLG
ncbi:MAG: LytTR family DNA-binding domain-containing protein [Bacteroidota bacterium]